MRVPASCAGAIAGNGAGAGRPAAGGDWALAAAARREKAVKQRLVVAADHFNRDYRKGLQYLQVVPPSSSNRWFAPWVVWMVCRACLTAALPHSPA